MNRVSFHFTQLLLPDCLSYARRPGISNVISVHGGQHNIVKTPSRIQEFIDSFCIFSHSLCHGHGGVSRLFWVQRWWGTCGLNAAESTATCTRVSHQHYRGRRCALKMFIAHNVLNLFCTFIYPTFSPPQHSPMLGHLASSHTVDNLRPRRSSLSCEKFLPMGISVLSQGGSLSLFSPLSRISLPP